MSQGDLDYKQNKIDEKLKNTPENPICTVCGEPVAYYIEDAICDECAGEFRGEED